MKTIYKYPLTATKVVLKIPADAIVLHTAAQHNQICLWIAIDTADPVVKRTFFYVGTGHPVVGDNVEYVGSALVEDAHYVFHVFEQLGESS